MDMNQQKSLFEIEVMIKRQMQATDRTNCLGNLDGGVSIGLYMGFLSDQLLYPFLLYTTTIPSFTFEVMLMTKCKM